MFAELGCINIMKEALTISLFVLNFVQGKALRFLLKNVSDIP